MSNDKEFFWTDSLIVEMIYNKLPVPEHYMGNIQKCLDEFKKSKQRTPLFTTGGDNVLIFDRDRFYSVTDNFDIVFTDAVGGIHLTPQIISRSFSTEDAAKEYVLMNKPVLSLNEVISCSPVKKEEIKEVQHFKNLKEIVKQKIDGLYNHKA